MTGLITAERALALDNRFPTSGGSDFLGYSVDGATEITTVFTSRLSIGATGWAAARTPTAPELAAAPAGTQANAALKANANALTTAAAAAASPTPITHVAVFTAVSAGTRRTDWLPLDVAMSVLIGGTLTFPIGSVKFFL